jgi:hypothetical protein
VSPGVLAAGHQAPRTLDEALVCLRLTETARTWRQQCALAARRWSFEKLVSHLVLEEARVWWEKTVRFSVSSARFPDQDHRRFRIRSPEEVQCCL